MSLFRAGFWKDYIAVTVVTVVLGAGASAGAAAALDVVLGRAVTGLLGEAGEYDLVVHVREQSRTAAALELARLLAAAHEDATVHQGVTVAGSANFFIKLPEELKTQSSLEQLAASLGGLPGFNGYAWMLEPSVAVSGLRPGLRDLLAVEAAAVPGVRAAVRHGGSLTLLLESPEYQRAVTETLRERLAGRHVLEVRWPAGATVDETQILHAVADTLKPRTLRDVTVRSGRGMTPRDDAADTLRELLPLWRRLAAAGARAAYAADTLVQLLDALEPALALSETPEEQGERLSEAVRAGHGADALRQALVRVLAANLVRALNGEAPDSPPELPSRAQLEELRATLAALAEDAASWRDVAQEDVAAALEALEGLLPAPDADGGVLELFTEVSVDPDAVAQAVREWTGYEVAVFASSPGVIRPSPRGVVAELLTDVRRTIAGMLAVVIAGAALALDQATVFSAAALFPGSRRGRAALAAGVGAVLVGATYSLSGGGIPFIGAGAATALGTVLGLLVMAVAHRLSPVNTEEILAGQALGLSDGQIMREIVVPAGRPGLLVLFNGPRRQFR